MGRLGELVVRSDVLVIIVTSSSVSVFLVKIMRINDKISMKISSINTYKI